MSAFNVYKGRKLIDTVFYSGNITADEVRQSLIDHDNYDADIRVTKARAKPYPIKHATQKTKDQRITRFHISGKRWFQKSYGNTYHSAQVSALIDDRWVHLGGVDYTYGYGDNYLQTGIDWLINNGFLNDGEHYKASGAMERYEWQYRADNCIDSSVQDVSRKRDL